MNQVTIREASEEDLPTLRRMEQSVVEAERPFNAMLREGPAAYYDIDALIASEQSMVLVADHLGKVIASGYATLKGSLPYLIHDRHAYLGFMYVDPDFRGQGIIQQIIGELMDWSRTRGVSDFYLEVYADNAAAIKAYEKYGFRRNLIEMKLCESSD